MGAISKVEVLGTQYDLHDRRVSGVDTAPTDLSGNVVTSGGVKIALDGKVDKVLMTKEYPAFTAAADNQNKGWVYFINVVPTSDNYFDTWYIRYKLYVTTSENATCGVYDVYVSTHGNTISYASWNDFYSISYRPIYNSEIAWHNSAAKYANRSTYPIKIGARLQSARTPTSLARLFKIEVTEIYGCTVTFNDSLQTHDSFYNADNYGGLTELIATAQGLQETGDADTINIVRLTNTRLLAGTYGLKLYSLCMQDWTGAWQSFTTTSGKGTSKAKNTTGFRLGSPVYYLNRSSDVAGGEVLPANNIVSENFPNIDFRYSLNIAANSATVDGLVRYKPVFIVGTVGNDGLFYLDDTWWTQDEPTTADGKVYIKVCEAVYDDYEVATAKNYRGDLISKGAPWEYINGRFQPYVAHAHSADSVAWDNVSGKPSTFAPASHTHGDITNDGKIGSLADVPLITGAGGKITTGSFGTALGTFCQGNDSRLSDARTPTSHTHGDITNDGKIGTTSGLPLITTTDGEITTGSFGTTAGTFSRGHTHPYLSIDGGELNGALNLTSGGITLYKGSAGFSLQGDTPGYFATLIKHANNGLHFVGENTTFNKCNVLFKQDGKVGIGTTSPAYTLDVNGTLNATTLYQNGTALGTAATKDVAASGDAAATEVVLGNDSRLSDARTPTSHLHGNLQGDGTLQPNDITIGSGDKLVVTDSSDSSKVARASVSFDGSTTTKALSQKGTFETFLQSHQSIKTVNGNTITGSGNVSVGTVTGITMNGESKGTSGVVDLGNVVPFIQGTGNTAGTWLGSCDSITSYYDGLLILYKPSVAGAATTTLQINSLGAKTVYYNSTAKLTTHYPKNQPILLVYSASQNDGCWMALDNYVNSNTKNTAGATDTSSKIFLVGATEQSTYPQTYTHDTAYVGTDGHLYSNSKQVVNLSDSQALTNKTYNGYTLGSACAKNVAASGNDASTTEVVMGNDSRLSDSRVPTSHAVNTTTYGAGTTSNYGHVKTQTGDMNGTSSTDGIAAGLGHTHSNYVAKSGDQTMAGALTVGTTLTISRTISGTTYSATLSIDSSGNLVITPPTGKVVKIAGTVQATGDVISYQ